jgi:hypothetical protein
VGLTQPPTHQGNFYKALVQSVLLYGSKSWTATMLATLNSFHNKVARRIAGLMPEVQDNAWYYPPLDQALKIAGLLPIKEYIRTCQNTVTAYIATRPILRLCETEATTASVYR